MLKKMSLALGLAVSAGMVEACDMCSCAVGTPSGGTGLFLSGQYSKFGAESADEPEFKSSSTQFGLLQRLSDRWSVQGVLPYLNNELGDESETGLGDATVAALYRLVDCQGENSSCLLDAYVGVKLPTGNTDPLKEDRDAVAMTDMDHDMMAMDHDHAAMMAEEHVHGDGHHLALGSGSWDGFAGLRGSHTEGRWTARAEGQYQLKTEGDYDFEYGDCLLLNAGLYCALIKQDNQALSLGANVLHDWRDDNKVLGQTQDGSGATITYAGPGLEYSLGSQFSAGLAWDVALEGENRGAHGAADTRWRMNLALSF